MEPIPFPANQWGNKFESGLARSKAFNLIKARSFFRQKITLASGRESGFYFDMKPTMLNPEGANCLAELVINRLEGVKVDYIGGLALGAVPLIAAVCVLSASRSRPLPGFFVRKEIKDHGTKKLVEGVEDADLKGKSVVILDDVTTSGSSAMIAVETARKAGATIILVLSIVDRGEGATELYKKERIPFEALFTAEEFLSA
jgi:orotate phosphoribosyltransferase